MEVLELVWEHKHYVFMVLPFGLATTYSTTLGVYQISKTNSKVSTGQSLRATRIVLHVYFANGLAMGTGFEQMTALRKLIR